LLAAGAQISSYDRYTFYRMLGQLGTDSAPESGKMNVNYLNVDANGNAVPGMETNLIAWDDPRIPSGIPGVIPAYGRRGSEVFFINAADRLLRNYTTAWYNRDPGSFSVTFGPMQLRSDQNPGVRE